METKTSKKKLIEPEVLVWVFFASQGITDNVDLTRCHILCLEIANQIKTNKNVSVESIKNTSAYKGCIYDIPDRFLTNEKIQEIIDFKI